MKKGEKIFMALFVLLTIIFLLSIVAKIAYPQEAHVGEQVVFKLDHRDSLGRYVMEPQEVRIAYVITPIEGDHPAPIPDKSLMLCRPYNEGSKYYLRCGGRYAVQAISLIPNKGDQR